VRFGLARDGGLLDHLGTSTGSRKVQLYNGRAIVSVRLKGDSIVSVSSGGMRTAFITLAAAATAGKPNS
jgi:beta-galactosidase